MKVVKGNKTIEISKNKLEELCKGFTKVVIDLGTGDGRYVYKSALKNPQTLFIGIDPAEKQMEEFSKKTVRKKMKNVLFAIGSLELLPLELEHIADALKILLPWGSLLKAVAQPSKETVEKIGFLLKKNAKVEIIFGYHPEAEPTETARLELFEIYKEDILKNIVPIFVSFGYKNLGCELVSKKELSSMETTWGKRISQREERQLYRLELEFTGENGRIA